MKRTREEMQANGRQFVFLEFTREEGDTVINDAVVRAAMREEGLRPVTQPEFLEALRPEVRRPETQIVAFGNITFGDSEARFTGVPYLDTDGNVKVVEDWTRGDKWGETWKFVFAPAG